MSLDLDCSKVSDPHAAWEIYEPDKPLYKFHQSTVNIAFMCMATGIGEITEKNYADFYTRIAIWERVCETPEPEQTSLARIRQLIGLRTNVSKRSRTEFMKALERKVADEIWAECRMSVPKLTDLEKREQSDASTSERRDGSAGG